ncbi:MAG: radical SAM protein [Paludibacteraceae bacterium]|nr:radical SAM protein [Paludibacteraceae bacterium]
MLFDSIIYGPIHSRRLGTSLGVNLMPTDHKLCSFNCVYCECGWNSPVQHPVLPTVDEFERALEAELSNHRTLIDAITFSGNGEPTLHPDFLGIMKATVRRRDQYCPEAKISVLSNSTQLTRPEVVEALRMSDNRILKLDSAIDATMQKIDKPVNSRLTVADLVSRLEQFSGDFTLQTCFLRGTNEGEVIDNTTPEELAAWYKVVEHLQPKQIMIYVIDRTTPCPTLEKIPSDEMKAIAAPLQAKEFNVIISA